MKSKILVLFTLSFLSLSFISCSEDDDNNNNPDQVEFTSTNYIYEGDLRKYYLEARNTELELQITAWDQVSPNDPGYAAAQANIVEAYNEIDSNNQESLSIASPNDAFFIINPIPPLPPPLPCLCLDVYNSVANIVFQSGNDVGNITITSEADQSTLVNTNANTQMHTIPETNGLGRYQSFNFPNNFTGQATITVQTDNGSYSILANFQDL